jgi:hypothetical protein
VVRSHTSFDLTSYANWFNTVIILTSRIFFYFSGDDHPWVLISVAPLAFDNCMQLLIFSFTISELMHLG